MFKDVANVHKGKSFMLSMEIFSPSVFLDLISHSFFIHLSEKLLETCDVYDDPSSLFTTENPSTLEFSRQSGFLS